MKPKMTRLEMINEAFNYIWNWLYALFHPTKD